MFSKILYPVDLSDASSKIQPYVQEMSDKFNSEIHLLYVAQVVHHYSYIGLPTAYIGDFENQVVKNVEKKLKPIADAFKNRTVICKTLRGHPGMEIVKYATKTGIDLIIMGHSSTGIERAIFGSVAGHVVKYSPAPVLVISPEILKSDNQ